MATKQQVIPFDDLKKNYAYQLVGYPALSQWMASSNDCFLVRRFGAVTTRSLLYLQHQIAKREIQLENLDADSMNATIGQGGCHSFEQDEEGPRGKVLNELLPLLERYHALTNAFAQVKSRPPASDRQLQNFDRWFETYNNAIKEDEKHFLEKEHKGDLAPIMAKTRTPLWLLLSKFPRLDRFFKSSPRSDRLDSADGHYYSDTGIDIFASILVVLTGLCFLFAPMWWLNWVSNDVYRLGIITGGISLFAACLSVAAGPRPFEILAGTAAYSAVLMVYLQVNK